MEDLASLNIALLRAKASRLQQAHPNDLRGTKNLEMTLLLFQSPIWSISMRGGYANSVEKCQGRTYWTVLSSDTYKERSVWFFVYISDITSVRDFRLIRCYAVSVLTLKTKELRSLEMCVTIYQSMQHNFAENYVLITNHKYNTERLFIILNKISLFHLRKSCTQEVCSDVFFDPCLTMLEITYLTYPCGSLSLGSKALL